MRLKSKSLLENKNIPAKISILAWRIVPIVIILAAIWAQSNLIVAKQFVYKTNIPKSFVGYKIVNVSDIHNSSLNVASIVKKQNPDIIIVSGGFTDDKGNTNHSAKTLEKLARIAPTYYVYNMNDVQRVDFSSTGAIYLDESVVELANNNSNISAEQFIEKYYGTKILDLARSGDEDAISYVHYVGDELTRTTNMPIALIGDNILRDEETGTQSVDKINNLLNNQYEYSILALGDVRKIFDTTNSQVDLILSGGTYGSSAHLGSPIYTKGYFGLNGAGLFICGGISNSSDIRRLANLPEVQVITLSDGTISNMNTLEKFLANFYTDVDTIFDNDGGFKKGKVSVEDRSKQKEE